MDALPAYTSQNTIGGTSHSVKHEDGGLAVQFFSHAASSTSPPIFHNDSVISGTLHLEVQGSLFASIQSVTVMLRGFQREMRGVFGQPVGVAKNSEIGQTTFVSVKQELYAHNDSKLAKGSYSWPFALTFPKTFKSVSKKAPDEEFELPPTFSSPGYPMYLLYELRCKVSKSALGEDEIMSIPIKFIPRKQAGRPSDARVLAYETGTPIASPLRDPEGWFTTLATTKVRVFKVRDVDIVLRFSLALPLEYARGTYVPFHLTVTCDDQQTIDLLCSPGAFAVLLDRRLHVSEPSGRRADEDRGNGPDSVGMGRYWRPESDGEGPNTREFEGEIAVGSQLLQSFGYPKLHLQYAVIVTVQADGITPLSKDPIFSVPVEVVYFPPRGVKPIAYAPKQGDESPQYIGNKPPILMVDL